MSEKKHAPIKQLREAGKAAMEMLREKGIHTQESAVDRILKENRIILPGIPAYLPHRWTLQMSRRYLKDIIRLWVDKNKSNQKRQENTTEFFTFLVKELNALEKAAQDKVDKMPSILKQMKDASLPVHKVFSSWQQLETTQAITRFMVDSFAVSMVVKEHSSTTQFVEWFMGWTQDLEQYWARKDQKDG